MVVAAADLAKEKEDAGDKASGAILVNGVGERNKFINAGVIPVRLLSMAGPVGKPREP